MLQKRVYSFLQKKLLYPRSGVFVCQSPRSPFHWFNCYAYLKLGVLTSCQLQTCNVTLVWSQKLYGETLTMYFTVVHHILESHMINED